MCIYIMTVQYSSRVHTRAVLYIYKAFGLMSRLPAVIASAFAVPIINIYNNDNII